MSILDYGDGHWPVTVDIDSVPPSQFRVPSPAAVLVQAPSSVEVKSGSVKSTNGSGGPPWQVSSHCPLPFIGDFQCVVAAVPSTFSSLSILLQLVVLSKYANYLLLLFDSRHNSRYTTPLTRGLCCWVLKPGTRREHGLPCRSRSRFALLVCLIFYLQGSLYIDDKTQSTRNAYAASRTGNRICDLYLSPLLSSNHTTHCTAASSFWSGPVAVAFVFVIESDFSLALVHCPLMTRSIPKWRYSSSQGSTLKYGR